MVTDGLSDWSLSVLLMCSWVLSGLTVHSELTTGMNVSVNDCWTRGL